jgi:hypothetical protein
MGLEWGRWDLNLDSLAMLREFIAILFYAASFPFFRNHFTSYQSEFFAVNLRNQRLAKFFIPFAQN